MTKFNAENFLNSIPEEEGAAGVDRAFGNLSRLPATAYEAAVDSIESCVLSVFKGIYAQLGAAEFKENIKLSSTKANARTLIDLKMLSQAFLNIHKIKGDAADPLVKNYVQESQKLTDAEYNSVKGQASLHLAMVDALEQQEKAAPKANPARPKPPRI